MPKNQEKEITFADLEQLKIEYEWIKKQLEELKEQLKDKQDWNNKEKSENLEKAQYLNNKAREKAEEITKAIKKLKETELDKAKEEIIKEIETNLKSEKENINKLYTTIIESLWFPSTETTISTWLKKEKNKNVFQKMWGWIWKQWNNLKSRDKRKEQPWKNFLNFLLFWLWTWLTWYGIYKWVKKLSNWVFWKKKKKNWNNKSNTEKKSFWKTTWWNILKWLWIWSTTWWLIYFLGKNFNWRWNKNKNKDNDNDTNTQWPKSEKAKTSNWESYTLDPLNFTIPEEIKQTWESLKWNEKPDLEPFACAMKAYKEEKEKWHLKNAKYITVIDFTKNQLTNNRLFVINLETNTVEYAEKCWHWTWSGWKEWTTSFSNKRKSNQSSLWAFITPDQSRKSPIKSRTWLYPIWQETSNNSSQWRWIAIHPVKSLIYKSWIPTSLWCFSIPAQQDYINKIIDKIKWWSLIFAYAKSKDYFTQSKYFQIENNNVSMIA